MSTCLSDPPNYKGGTLGIPKERPSTWDTWRYSHCRPLVVEGILSAYSNGGPDLWPALAFFTAASKSTGRILMTQFWFGLRSNASRHCHLGVFFWGWKKNKQIPKTCFEWTNFPPSKWGVVDFMFETPYPKFHLVGGWTNPSEKYARQIGSFPQGGVKTKNIWNHHLGMHYLLEDQIPWNYIPATFAWSLIPHKMIQSTNLKWSARQFG